MSQYGNGPGIKSEDLIKELLTGCGWSVIETRKAADTYTAADDGLEQSWYGRVWVNPPYSAMSEWTAKATTETRDGDAETVVYLCKGDSSSGWWQRAATAATLVCAIDHRLSFGDGENSAPFASHLIVFGECPDALVAELATQGQLLKPTEADA